MESKKTEKNSEISLKEKGYFEIAEKTLTLTHKASELWNTGSHSFCLFYVAYYLHGFFKPDG
jgi:hypothetical protein